LYKEPLDFLFPLKFHKGEVIVEVVLKPYGLVKGY